MHVSSRLQCAVIAVAILPCWATAQSSPVGNADASAVGSQLSATPVDMAAPQPGNAANAGAVPAPAAALEADPSPSSASTPVTGSEPGDQRAVEDRASGPSASSATAGIRSHVATEDLTRQQLADRASNRDQDGGRRGVGRDATLMILGGAAVIAGAVIGGSAGTAFIIVGAVIGITGLVLILS